MLLDDNMVVEFDIPWTEKYRPKNLKDVIGQKEIVERLQSYVKAKNMPNMLFSGRAGIGKTSAAIALANDLFGEVTNMLELNASDERGIAIVRGKIKDFARTLPLGGAPFKIIFLDEADALTADAQQALRRTMERFSSATRFILSVNYSSKIIEPLQSRCAVFRFRPLAEADIKKQLQTISQAESLTLTDKAIDAIFYLSEGDLRRAITILQGAANLGAKVTDDNVYKVSSRAKPKEITEMVEAALKGDFLEAREKLDTIMLTYGMSGEDVITQMYRELVGLSISDRKKVALVDKIGEYNFRLVEGANERIQLEALLAQVMLIGTSKD